MATIKSDLTNKKYPSGLGMREIEVPDESEQLYDYSQDQGPPPQDLDLDAVNARLASRGLPPLDTNGGRAMQARKALQTESVKEFETKVAEARKFKATGKERLSEAAKRRIEILCGLFSSTKEVNIDGNIFLLRTLKGKEAKEALLAAALHDGMISLSFESRTQLLSRSLMEIAGTDAELFLGDSSVEAKMEFLDELPEPILARLFAGYSELVNETNAKYAVKNEKDAREVAADLKK